jgi:ferredoxin
MLHRWDPRLDACQAAAAVQSVSRSDSDVCSLHSQAVLCSGCIVCSAVCSACALTSHCIISEVVQLGVVVRGPLGANVCAGLVAC